MPRSYADLYRIVVHEVFVKRNLAAWEEVMHPSYCAFDPGNDRGPSRESARRSLEDILSAFANIRYEVLQTVTEGDTVAAHWLFEATHVGPYAGKPASGRRITTYGMSFNRFQDGKIIEGKILTDLHGALQQMIAPPIDLYYQKVGEGRPLFVMHGGLGLDQTYLRPALEPLGRGAELIFYDHRGNGRSPAPKEWSLLTHEAFSQDADKLRIELGHEKVFVLGHSYGSFLALQYALRYPERVAGLILVGCAASLAHMPSSFELAKSRLSAAEFEQLFTAFTNPAPSDEYFAGLWPVLQRAYFRSFELDKVRKIFSQTRYCAAALNQGSACLANYNVAHRLAEVRAPTLVVVGAYDWVTPPECAKVLQNGIPDCELVVMEESGHYPFLEEPERFTQSVLSWLERQ